MTGMAGVIAAIQGLLASEARAVDQYHQDASVLENLGLPALAAAVRKLAAEEEEHRRELLDRITALDGAPSYAATATEYRGDVAAVIRGNLTLENQARAEYAAAVRTAGFDDAPSYALFADTQGDEEDHIQFWEAEARLYAELGHAGYVSAWKAAGANQ